MFLKKKENKVTLLIKYNSGGRITQVVLNQDQDQDEDIEV